jgi:hypothetical protein
LSLWENTWKKQFKGGKFWLTVSEVLVRGGLAPVLA